jgi:RNA polymerase sigma factor (sigma-70 family)
MKTPSGVYHRKPRIEASPLIAELLHVRYITRIRRHVDAVLGPDDERDDILQEVLITAVLKLGTLREPARFDAWLGRVTANTINDFLRRRRLRRRAAGEAFAERSAPTFKSDFDARDLAARAIRILYLLPESDRALLTRFWFTPATKESMAAEYGCSHSTMQRWLGRARARFEKRARRDPALGAMLRRTQSRTAELAPTSRAPRATQRSAPPPSARACAG